MGWGAVYLENHDQNRSVNKYLPDEDIHYYSKTMLASLFLFLRGHRSFIRDRRLAWKI